MQVPDVSRRTALGAIAAAGTTGMADGKLGAEGTSPGPRPPSANVFDNLSTAQRAGVLSGTSVPFLVEAIEEIANSVGRAGGTLFMPAGLYDFRKQLNLHPTCWLVGEGSPWPVAKYNPGFARVSGVVIFKRNNDPATILVEGGGAYAPGGGLEGLSISGDATDAGHNRGDGLVVNNIGGYSIKRFRAFSVPGNALVLGTDAGDVTGQLHLDEVYINNPAGNCLVNRSRWLKATKIECDGGMISYDARDGAQADIMQFHFEGARTMAISLGGANVSARFRGGFVSMTDPEARKMIEVANERGNVDVTFEDMQMVGRQTLEAGIDVMESAWRTSILNCEISNCSIGVRDRARGTRVSSKFLECRLNIEAHGEESNYCDSRFVGTRGAWAIDHRAGGSGIWMGLHTDKPFRSTASGRDGDFGGTIVKDNQGYRSMRRGRTPPLASGTPIAHGLAATPYWIDARPTSSRPGVTIDWQADGRSITPVWKGGGLQSFNWQAALFCETP